MTLKDALVSFGVSGFVSKAALGRGSSLLPSTILVFSWLVVAFALVALFGVGGTVGACGARLLACVLPCAGGAFRCWWHRGI